MKSEYLFWDVPTQVAFRSFEGGETDFCIGIAYHDEIICACCGGCFEIAELAQYAAEDGVDEFIWPYSTWVDLTSEIQGGEYPEGFPVEEIGN